MRLDDVVHKSWKRNNKEIWYHSFTFIVCYHCVTCSFPILWFFTAKDYVSFCSKKQLYLKKRRQKDKETKDFRKEKDQNDLEFGAQSVGSSCFPYTSHDEPFPLLKFQNISSPRHDFRSFHCYTGVGEKQKLLKFCDQTNCIRSIHTSKSRLNF